MILTQSIAVLAAVATQVVFATQVTFTMSTNRPNVVVILSDDQDAKMGSMEYMPLVKKHLADKGAIFNSHYCTVSLCCPSRVSLWTGKAAHNHNVTTVDTPHGGYPKFISQGLNDNYLPVWLQEAGYATYYVGKLFNSQTVQNYNNPFPNGWTGSEFLLDPFTYQFFNPWFVRNNTVPKSYTGQYSTDVVGEKALDFLDDAAKNSADKPFFLAIAPIAPHAEVEFNINISGEKVSSKRLNDSLLAHIKNVPSNIGVAAVFTPPKPAARYATLFSDKQVPRTPNFNPETPSGADWLLDLPQLSAENITYNDEWYRQRLRSLQSIDEMVEKVVHRLESHGLLDNTYIFYTADNGYHISQHRLPPGKGCPYEPDLNVPLVVRGPGIAPGSQVDLPSAHIDLSPTFLKLMGIKARPDFDGAPIPLTTYEVAAAKKEHVQVEFWSAINNNEYMLPSNVNNTYKSLRVISTDYNLAYTVWCAGSHELYDMKANSEQLHNLYNSSSVTEMLGVTLTQLQNRLDGLLFVSKTCSGDVCRDPWGALLPGAGIDSLAGALDSKFDTFFAELPRVSYSMCKVYYDIDAEQPIFPADIIAARRETRA